MEFEFNEAQRRLQDEARGYLRDLATPELLEETWWGAGAWGPATRQFVRKLGERGWLTPHWPEEFGGLGASNVERLIIYDELDYQGLRFNSVATGMAGPTIMRFGSEEQKKNWMLPIAHGEIEFALGYTEPQAGSDLAALEMRAVEDGDYFVVNGMKTFNTGAHFSDYHWLGARTERDAPKHKGISLFIVDLKSPGITIRPLWTLGGYRVNEVYYDDVRVPKENLVGTRGRGFQQIAVALDFERMFTVGSLVRALDEMIEYANEAKSMGKPLAADGVIRYQLAEIAADIEVARLLTYNLAWLLDQGHMPSHESAMAKVYLTETQCKLTHLAMKILGPLGQLQHESPWAPIDGRFEHHHRHQVVQTIYAGTSEIMRNIIAQRGLGLPRA